MEKDINAIILHKWNTNDNLISYFNTLFTHVKIVLEKVTDIKIKQIEESIGEFKSLQSKNKELMKGNLSNNIQSIDSIQSIIEIYQNLDTQFEVSHTLINWLSDPRVITHISDGRSESFITEINNTILDIQTTLSQYTADIGQAAELIVKQYSKDGNLDGDFKQLILKSRRCNLIIQLAKYSSFAFKGTEIQLLKHKIDEWKDSLFGIERKTQPISYGKHVVMSLPHPTSRFGIVPVGPFLRVDNISKEIQKWIDNEDSFILFNNPQNDVIQYNILPLVNAGYVMDKSMDTQRDSLITDKVLDRFMNIRKIDTSSDKSQNDKPPNTSFEYYIKSKCDIVSVYEYHGHGVIAKLTTVGLDKAVSIINNDTEITEEYNKILESEIIKNNKLENIKSKRTDFEQTVQISLDIITEKIQEPIVNLLKGIEELPYHKYGFINIIEMNDKFAVDYALLEALSYARGNGPVNEANMSYLSTVYDVIFAFKRELKSGLKTINVPQRYFNGENKDEFREFIIDMYKMKIKDAVIMLQRGRSMWDDIALSLKNSILDSHIQ